MSYFRSFFASLLLFSLFPTTSSAFSLIDLIQPVQETMQNDPQSRIQAWKKLIADTQTDSVWQKLNKVNRFFNQLKYVEDKTLWGVKDYWATPVEFLTNNAGDCEDYAIAKYITLKALGVDVNRLRVTYVMSSQAGQAHMVLVYLEGEAKTPLVLDNLSHDIEPMVSRTDLDPVYSFNHNGLWLATREVVSDQYVGSTQQVSLWQGLSGRLARERFL